MNDPEYVKVTLIVEGSDQTHTVTWPKVRRVQVQPTSVSHESEEFVYNDLFLFPRTVPMEQKITLQPVWDGNGPYIVMRTELKEESDT